MSVAPVTLADAAFYGASAAGNSGNASPFSSDSQLLAFDSDGGNLTAGDFNGLSDVFVRNVSTGAVTLVSANLSGNAGTGASSTPRLSADGRYVAFESVANDLVAGDSNGATRDVFRRDLQTGTTQLVSVNQTGGSGNNQSIVQAISSDGRLVLFASSATNLVSTPLSDRQLFVRDMVAGTTTLVTISFDGSTGANGPTPFTNQAQFSPDNRFVLFDSIGTNLASNDTNGIFSNVFVRDLQLNTTTLIDVNSGGVNSGNSQSVGPVYDPTGRYIAFASLATDLIAGGAPAQQAYVRDTLLGTTTLVSVDNTFDGETPRQSKLTPFLAFSPNGRYLAYEGEITDLTTEIYARDLTTNSTLLVSANKFGDHLSDGHSLRPTFSADSQSILFSSTSTILVEGVSSGVSQIYARNLVTNTTSLVSVSQDSSPGDGASTRPAVSPDGQLLWFQSLASGLVANDNNALQDVFLRNLSTSSTTLASQRNALLPQAYTSRTTEVTPRQPTGMSADGRYVVFTSEAKDLVTLPVFFGRNVFRRDLVTGQTALVSVSADGLGGGQSGNGTLGNPVISADGRFVAFDSGEAALVNGLQFAPGIFGVRGIFVRDMTAGTTRAVNVNTLGQVAGNGGDRYAISPNGRYVAFATVQPLLAADTNAASDAYVFDLQTNTLSLVSTALGGLSGNNFSTILGTSGVGTPQNIFSDDGRYLVFSSRATDLVAAGGATDALYVRDLQTGTTTLVSVDSGGVPRPASGESLSADGARVSFVTQSQLSPSDSNGQFDVYVRDVAAATTTHVSASQAFGGFSPLIGRDGGHVLYSASVPSIRLLQYDLSTQNTLTIHTGSDVDYFPAMSDDGRFVAFLNLDATLAAGDTNNASDLFLFDRQSLTTTLLSANQAATGTGNRGVALARPVISASGARVVFASDAYDYITNDVNGARDIFAFTQPLGAGQLLGQVFSDVDASGTRDSGEGPLALWQVFLDDGDGVLEAGEAQTLTDGSGNFAFTGLAAGTYHVVAETRAGFVRTAPPAGFYDATIVLAETIAGLDFGFQQQLPNLVIDSVLVPANGEPGENISVGWTVSNSGALDAAGNWQDAIYLSRNTTLDASDILLDTAPFSGGLTQGLSYLTSRNVSLPAVAPGIYYIFVESDRRNQVSEISESDNVLVSAATITVDVPELVLDVPQPDDFTTSDEHYYKINPPAGRSLLISLDSLAADGATAIYISRNRLPTPGDFDFRATALTPDQQLLVPRTVDGGTYYVLIEGRLESAASSGLTLLATLPGLTVSEVSPNTGGNTGQVTVRIDGSEFTSDALVEISQGFTTIAASVVDFRDASLLYATFDLLGAAVGDYDVRVNTGLDLEVAVGAFHVVPGQSMPLAFHLATPSLMRPDRQHPVVVEVTNNGNVDVPAPLLALQADDGYLRFPDQNSLGGPTLPFLATSLDGPAGVLRPGQTSRVVLSITSFLSNFAPLTIQLQRPSNLNQFIDWNSLKAAAQPSFVANDAWDVIWDRVQTAAGPTVESYQQYLGQAANYLGELGVRTSDTSRLLNLSLALADNSLFDSVVASNVDLSMRQPELSLGIERTFTHSISSRYRLGPLGRGWTHQAEVSLDTDDAGNVTIEFGGQTRRFIREPGGSFVGAPGDDATLVFQAGHYVLREVHGLIQVFRPDGKLDYFEETNGGRITFGYDLGGRLVSQTHNNGGSLTLAYNAQGRLASVTSSDGKFATYTYDASGEYLATVTTQGGVLAYSYDTNPASPSFRALTTAADFEGVVSEFFYDSAGRLSQRQLQGGLEPLTYTYGAWGEFTITDADGASLTTRLNEFAQPETMTDSLGGVNEFDYDKFRHLARTRDALGVTQFYQFTSCGSLLSAVDALGNKLQASYEPQYRELADVVDQRGNRTEFDHDALGNIVAEIRADGTSRQFVYDTDGNANEVTNRNGDVVQYAYDAAGRVQSVTAPGGILQTFTYDTQGRLLTAADPSGAIELDYDPVTNLLMRVDYPNGRFIEYQYDPQRRLSRINQDGFIVNYAYDGVGRLTDATDINQALITHYDYDDRGFIAQKTSGNGAYVTYAYDGLGHLESLVNRAPDDSINSRFDYTYNASNRRTSVTTLEGTTLFGYDLLGQLTSVVLPSGRTITYEYDAAGNRVRVTDDGVETNYAANNLNEYNSVGAATFTYDANGNLKTRDDSSGTTTYSYDALNQLVGVSGPGGTFSYEYDPLGNRIAETKNGVRREFLVEPTELGNILGAYDDQGSSQANYAYGLGIVGQFDSTDAYYFDFDALGSTVGLTGGAGDYVNEYTYLPFGETTVVAEAVPNPFRYVGQWGAQDSGDGLLHMGLRNYDPTTGQFVSDDPASFAGQDTNLRRYVGNDPVQFIDPKGLAKQPPPVNWRDGIDPEEYKKLHKVCKKVVEDANGILRTEEVPFDEFMEEFRKNGEEKLKNAPDYTKPKPGPPVEVAGDFEPTVKTKAPPQSTTSTLRRGFGRAAGAGFGAACAIGEVLGALDLADGVWQIMVNEIELSNLSIMLSSWDPNDIIGPGGPGGDAHYIEPNQSFPYIIHFENDPEQASAPAQEVFVTTQLDANLDWSTFELGDVGFGSLVVSVPAGLQSYHTQVNYLNQDGSPLLVDFSAALDIAAGVVTWTFRSLDPDTGSLPDGVFDGFLPVNDATGRGEGFVNFLVHPKAGLMTGDAINGQASIVFDVNSPVLTNVHTNTIDFGVPESAVDPLPANVGTTSFAVSWSGIDDADGKPGSGIATYDIYVSDNNGPFQIWLDDTTDFTADYVGQNGHTYEFFSVATDLLGHAEAAPATADAMTTVMTVNAASDIDLSSLAGLAIPNGDMPPSAGKTTDFGGAPVSAGIVQRVFVITNFGQADLNLTGAPRVQITGPAAGDFQVVVPPPASVPSIANRTFQVAFDPSAAGLRSALVSIASDDPDENPYTFAIQGFGSGDVSDIDLSSLGGVSIINGDSSPTTAKSTEFGNVGVSGGLASQVFVITNFGFSPLHLTGSPRVQITGANAADFQVTSPVSASVAARTNDTFQITFDPSAAGLRTATVSIVSDDPDESPYTFAIQGTGTSGGGVPDINLSSLGGVSIVSGDVNPTPAKSTEFGAVGVSGGMASQVFVITNFGFSALHLTGSPRVQITGAGAVDFQVTSALPASVAARANDTFQITFDPSAAGLRTATVSIASDDPDESPYTFAIQGTGTAGGGVPDIDLSNLSGVHIAAGDTSPSALESTQFGTVNIRGSEVTQTFVITNFGFAPLTLSGLPRVQLLGLNAFDFQIALQPPATVAARTNATFQVRFRPTAAGQKNATVRILSDDPDENPYDFSIQGTGTTAYLHGVDSELLRILQQHESLSSGEQDPGWANGGLLLANIDSAASSSETAELARQQAVVEMYSDGASADAAAEVA